MAALFDFPREPSDFDDLPPLIPKGTSEADRERVIGEIVAAWSTPLESAAGEEIDVGVTLNRVALFDAERKAEIDLSEILRRVEDRMRKEGTAATVVLRGCRIGACNCAESEMTLSLKVLGCHFGNGVDFSWAKFDNGSSFCRAEFGNRASFRGAEFGDFASFERTVFGDSADFTSAKFGDSAEFLQARIGDRAEFWRATFGDEASFVAAEFGYRANFSYAEFGGGANFARGRLGDRADFANAEFGERASFRGAELGDGASFTSAKFGDGSGFTTTVFGEGAGFAYANFGDDAGFVSAEFGDGATLQAACFGNEASFHNAKFGDRANFQWASFGYRADLRESSLRRANLCGADFNSARLLDANLEDADLRRVSNLRLDSTIIRNARFSPHSRDLWSVLRRTYTGPRLLFTLLFLVAFFTPYVAKTLFWLGVHRLQVVLPINENFVKQTTQVWRLVIGADKGWLYWTLAVSLLFYNVCKALMTWFVAPMRDEEERSGRTAYFGRQRDKGVRSWIDSWYSAYGWLLWPHRVIAALFWLAVISLVGHAVYWFSRPVDFYEWTVGK